MSTRRGFLKVLGAAAASFVMIPLLPKDDYFHLTPEMIEEAESREYSGVFQFVIDHPELMPCSDPGFQDMTLSSWSWSVYTKNDGVFTHHFVTYYECGKRTHWIDGVEQ